MTNLEPGYYWIAIRRTDGTLAAPEPAELIDGPNPCWYLIGDWREYSYDELVVLSERLSSPSATTIDENYFSSNGDS